MSTQDAPILASIEVQTSFITVTRNIRAPQNVDGTYDLNTANIQARIHTHMRRLLNRGIVDVDGNTTTYVPGMQIQKLTATVFEQKPAVVTDGDSGSAAHAVVPLPVSGTLSAQPDTDLQVAVH